MRSEGDMEGSFDGGFPILIPLFNDWDTFSKLALRLEEVLAGAGLRADILIVDDASLVEPGERVVPREVRALGRLRVLTLRRNLGHQRGIAIGLASLNERIGADQRAVVVM